MKITEMIYHLSRVMHEEGVDIELNFVLDVQSWHPPIKLHLFSIDEELPRKYGVTFRFDEGGQHTSQTKEGYRFQELAARAWMEEIDK